MSLSFASDMFRLQAHSALHQLAINMSAVFSAAFLLRQGLTPGEVFLAFAGVFTLRILMRPMIAPLLPVLGMRRMLIAGTALIAGQYASIVFVTGYDRSLAVYVVFMAFANMLYWTLYHPVFAAAGETRDRGRQLGARQSLSALAGILGPSISGLLLNGVGPWAAFGAAGLIALASIWPLLRLADYPVAKSAPPHAWRAALMCSALFAADGFLWLGSSMAWSMLLFERLGGRFDAYGFVLALAAVAGALASLTIGRSIDLGHGGKAVAIAGISAAVVFAMRALAGHDIATLLGVVVASTIIIHLYTPTLMTAYYNEAKKAPCLFRLQCAAETGWDLGAVLGCIAAAALLKTGFQLQTAIWLGLLAVAAQAALLSRVYGRDPPRPPARP